MARKTSLPRRLEAAGWALARTRKHQVWRCPCGQHQYVIPVSRSDHRGERNALSDLRRMDCPPNYWRNP